MADDLLLTITAMSSTSTPTEPHTSAPTSNFRMETHQPGGQRLRPILTRPGLIDHEVDQLGREAPGQQAHPDPLRVRLTSYVFLWHKTEVIDDLHLPVAEPSQTLQLP